MRRLARRRPEQMRGQIADIRIDLKLAPGPALMLLVHRDPLATERLSIERGVRGGRAADIRGRADHLHLTTFGENRGFDAALQMRRREIRAHGGEAAVEGQAHRSLLSRRRSLPRPRAFDMTAAN